MIIQIYYFKILQRLDYVDIKILSCVEKCIDLFLILYNN